MHENGEPRVKDILLMAASASPLVFLFFLRFLSLRNYPYIFTGIVISTLLSIYGFVRQAERYSKAPLGTYPLWDYFYARVWIRLLAIAGTVVLVWGIAFLEL